MQASIKKARNSNDRVGDVHTLVKDMLDNLTRTCLNCAKYQVNPKNPDEEYRCAIFNAKPPPRILINGCEQHSDNIPF